MGPPPLENPPPRPAPAVLSSCGCVGTGASPVQAERSSAAAASGKEADVVHTHPRKRQQTTITNTLRDLAEKLGCPLLGDSSITVTKVSSLQSAKSDSLVFVDDAQHLDAALRSSAAAVIAGDFAAGNVAASTTKPILIAVQPRLTFARAAKLLRTPRRNRAIHPSAIVPASAEIGKNVAIGPRAILGEHVKVGDETTIGAGSVIGGNAGEDEGEAVTRGDAIKIGSHCRLDPNVTIYPGTTQIGRASCRERV